jgi:hypothetical protein
VNLTELGGLSDPFTSVVVKFADRYRLHVTHCVTCPGLVQLPAQFVLWAQLAAGAAGVLLCVCASGT